MDGMARRMERLSLLKEARMMWKRASSFTACGW